MSIVRHLVRRIEQLEVLDGISDQVSGLVNSVATPAKSLLSGTWLGHPLHPVLTDVPIGCWTGAVALDLLGGDGRDDSVDWLVGLGTLSALPTVATGLSDWADTYGPERRVGVVHALVNLTGIGLFASSLVAGGGRARSLRLLGLGAVLGGGYLGGHLSFAQGVGVDHTVFETVPTEWTDVLASEALEEARPTLAEAGGAKVVLYRRAARLFAIAATCTHAGGPLDEGEVDDDLCVTCPWHGSRFRLTDGVVIRGPATASETAYEARVVEGRIQVRALA